jgi:hypothetical protein
MIKTIQEKTERTKSIKILLARWIIKQETAEKAAVLLLKNPHIKLAKALKLKVGLKF